MKIFDALSILILLAFIDLVSGRRRDDVKFSAKRVCKKLGRKVFEDGRNFCCTCPPGHKMKSGCKFGEPHSTWCVTCDAGTFMDEENNSTECTKSRSNCRDFMNTHLIPGSSTQPAKCVCDKNHFATEKDMVIYGCSPHTLCNPGYQPAKLGTAVSNTKCQLCPTGTFSNTYSAVGQCTPFAKCDLEYVKDPGNETTDLVCSNVSLPSAELEISMAFKGDITTAVHPSQTPEVTGINRNTTAINDTFGSVHTWLPICLPVSGIVIVLAIVLVWKKRNRKGSKAPRKSFRKSSRVGVIDNDLKSGRHNMPDRESESKALMDFRLDDDVFSGHGNGNIDETMKRESDHERYKNAEVQDERMLLVDALEQQTDLGCADKTQTPSNHLKEIHQR